MCLDSGGRNFFEIVWEFRRKIRQIESERALEDFGVVRSSGGLSYVP